MKTPFSICRLLLALPLAIAGSLRAHDIALYSDVTGNRVSVRVKFGHPGDYRYVDLKRLFTFSVGGPDGQSTSARNLLKREGNDYDLVLQDGPSTTRSAGTWMFYGSYDNGYYVQTMDGEYINTSLREWPTPTKGSWHYLKCFKTIVYIGKPSPGYDRIIGSTLELIPQSDPFALKIGDQLPVLVLFKGKPLAGVDLENRDGVSVVKEADIPLYKTNGQGIALVPITKPGMQLIGCDFYTDSKDKELAAAEEIIATLSFSVGK